MHPIKPFHFPNVLHRGAPRAFTETDILRESYREGTLWIPAKPPADVLDKSKYDRIRLSGALDRSIAAFVNKSDRNQVYVREGSFLGRDSWKKMVLT